MARPKKEGMDYFPHDTDAVNDEKIEALRMLYGNDGYAFYFILLERIYRAPNAELDISDAETIQILSRKIAISEEKFHQILATALKRGVFDRKLFESKGILTSSGIKKRAEIVIEKREKMRKAYKIKVSDGEVTEVVSASETREETTPETPQSKVKESKEKKSSITADEKPGPFERVFDTYTHLRNISPVNVNAVDIDLMQKLIQSGIPPDFIIQEMREVAAAKEINSMKYFNKVIRDRWEKELALEEAEKSGFNSGNPPKDRGSGETSAGTGYFDQFNFIKSV